MKQLRGGLDSPDYLLVDLDLFGPGIETKLALARAMLATLSTYRVVGIDQFSTASTLIGA